MLYLPLILIIPLDKNEEEDSVNPSTEDIVHENHIFKHGGVSVSF